MPQPSTTMLQAPKSGRSRFSKALPSVPGLDDAPSPAAESPLPLPPKDLPRLPPLPASDTFSMPIFNPSSSPLPPLPTPKTPSSFSPSALPPSKMAIPRRPVGKPAVSSVPPPAPAPAAAAAAAAAAPTPTPVVASTPASASTPAILTPGGLSAPVLPPEPHSPNDSLSSLLSAYSRSSDDLVLQPSDENGGNGQLHVHVRDFDDDTSPIAYDAPHQPSAPAAAPRKDAAPAPQLRSQHISPSSSNASSGGSSDQTRPKAASVSRKPAPSLDRSLPLPPPPPPSKDVSSKPQPAQPQSQPPNQRPASPPRQHQQHQQKQPSTSSDLSIATPSPPRPQIWRRRSLKGSRELPDLKLNYSHGSTAATLSAAATAPPGDTDRTPALPPAPTPAKPQSANPAALKVSPLPAPPTVAGGLPGRNIRPVPPKASVDESQTMGSGASKLKHLKDKLRSSHRSQGSSGSSRNEPAQRPSANRPPTPEYQKEDIKTPVLDTFISPVSPASSPEPAKEISPNISKELPPEPPKKAPARTEQKPVSRKAVAPAAPALHAAKSLPDLKVSTSTPVSEPPLPIKSAVDTRRHSPASEAAFGRNGDVVRPATRDGSVPPFRGSESRYSGPDSDPRLVRSDSRGTLYRGRTGILYPEMKTLREPDPRAFDFPIQIDEPLPYGAIIKAAPLQESHYSCFQKHRFMKRILNRNYPLTCQTCDKEDTEDRFACSFCHLRICESCSRELDGQKKDLRKMVDTLKTTAAATLSLSSPSRPGSALGLTFA